MQTKQAIGKLLNTQQRTPELEKAWSEAKDNRMHTSWEKQECVCGNATWCGRDSHRPDFAVDIDGGTVYYEEKPNFLTYVPITLNLTKHQVEFFTEQANLLGINSLETYLYQVIYAHLQKIV